MLLIPPEPQPPLLSHRPTSNPRIRTPNTPESPNQRRTPLINKEFPPTVAGPARMAQLERASLSLARSLTLSLCYGDNGIRPPAP